MAPESFITDESNMVIPSEIMSLKEESNADKIVIPPHDMSIYGKHFALKNVDYLRPENIPDGWEFTAIDHNYVWIAHTDR